MNKVVECNYEMIEWIGEGRFSDVYKCLDHATGENVAIKMITIQKEHEGIPSSVIREVSLLMEMDHINIVRLRDVLTWSPKYVYLVFEYLDADLDTFISNPEMAKNSLPVKNFLQQILCGVAHCHSHKVLHRDLKPQNLLIDLRFNIVKLADFGLARAFEVPHSEYTDRVGTPRYKAPELLLGSSQYSTAIDMWSVGCIFGEMVMRRPIFPGDNELEQLLAIFSLLGTPTEETWPGVTSITGSLYLLRKKDPKDLSKEFSGLEPAGVYLLSRILCLDPSKRISASDALEHEYFKDIQNVS